MDDESAQPSKLDAETPTPEVAQLLKLLDLQAAALREQRTGKVRTIRGDSFRYGSLLLIVIFAVGSVAAMEWMLSQLPKSPHPPPAASVTPAPSYKN